MSAFSLPSCWGILGPGLGSNFSGSPILEWGGPRPEWALVMTDKLNLLPLDHRLHSVAQSFPTLCDPTGVCPPGSSLHGDSPGKNTGVGCYALLQGIFWTQGWNPCLLHLLHWLEGYLPLMLPGKSTNTQNNGQINLEFVVT